MSTSLIFLQRQVFVQTGQLLPVVRNHNWYAADAFRDTGGEASEIIFWQNHVALKPDVALCLWSFVAQLVEGKDFAFSPGAWEKAWLTI